MKITHTPPLRYVTGPLVAIEFGSRGAECRIKSAQIETAHMDDVVLAQVDPVSNSPFTTVEVGQPFETLVVLPDGQLKLKSDDGTIRPWKNSLGEPLTRIQLFEMEQVLGAAERGEHLHAVLREAQKTYIGTIQGFDASAASPKTPIRIQMLDGGNITCAFSEIRVDPS